MQKSGVFIGDRHLLCPPTPTRFLINSAIKAPSAAFAPCGSAGPHEQQLIKAFMATAVERKRSPLQRSLTPWPPRLKGERRRCRGFSSSGAFTRRYLQTGRAATPADNTPTCCCSCVWMRAAMTAVGTRFISWMVLDSRRFCASSNLLSDENQVGSIIQSSVSRLCNKLLYIYQSKFDTMQRRQTRPKNTRVNHLQTDRLSITRISANVERSRFFLPFPSNRNVFQCLTELQVENYTPPTSKKRTEIDQLILNQHLLAHVTQRQTRCWTAGSSWNQTSTGCMLVIQVTA